MSRRVVSDALLAGAFQRVECGVDVVCELHAVTGERDAAGCVLEERGADVRFERGDL
jgi:hypothetical protein